ncbi:SCO family protein [Mucilaginibacter sp.]
MPGFLYYLLTVGGKNRYKPLPFFGPKIVAKTGHTFHGKYIADTIYHKLPEVSLLDQNGNAVSSGSFKGRITVVNFFYTQCPASCIRVCNYMDSLVQNYAKNKLVYFASVTVNPQHDDAGTLKHFAARYHVDAAKWRFLTGDTAQVYKLARQGFLVNAAQTGSNEFNFSNQMILIDAENRIRGYYTGGSIAEVRRLNDELKVQIAEELRKIKAPDM